MSIEDQPEYEVDGGSREGVDSSRFEEEQVTCSFISLLSKFWFLTGMQA